MKSRIHKFISAIIVWFFLLYLLSMPAKAADSFITSVDVMKYTKDVVANQPTDSDINAIVAAIMNNVHPQYIAISVPLDSSADYPIGSKPAPRSAISFTEAWVNAIRSHGAKVMFRGTWSGIEGIYNFPKLVGANRFPEGSVNNASSEKGTTWLGKTYQYIVNNPNLFADGDIWAILPERTEGIFSDSTSFLPYSDIQNEYVKFFGNLNTISNQAFAKINKKVITGMSSNNFSEAASGWILDSITLQSGMMVVDYYGTNHSPQEMETEISKVYNRYHKPIFLQEWGDYWNTNLSTDKRTAYLTSMYDVFKKLANKKILVGFNYWGGWINNNEGILVKQGSNYAINYRGQILADFFDSFNPKSNSSESQQSFINPENPKVVSPDDATALNNKIIVENEPIYQEVSVNFRKHAVDLAETTLSWEEKLDQFVLSQFTGALAWVFINRF